MTIGPAGTDKEPTSPQSHPARTIPPIQSHAYMSGFSKLNPDQKLMRIASIQSMIDADSHAETPTLTRQSREDWLVQLAQLEQEVKDKDTWYYKMFRTIAWGPTILINGILWFGGAVLAALWPF